MDNVNQIHTGVIKLGEFELPCYVVDDGTEVNRVLTQREVVKLITGGRESGNLQRYLKSRALEEVLPAGFVSKFNDKLLIINAGTYTINGVKADTVVDICNGYLKARQLGLLTPNQVKLAEQSEIFISALAKTGIDAVIDEATGYQYFRKANDLQAKLDAYIQEGYREWTKTFPREFFMQLYRLEGKRPPIIDKPYPKRFGKYVMHFIYDTLDHELADYLRENNPKPEGKKHHHQKFNDFGYKALTDHLFSILGIAKASVNMDRFKESLSFAFPNARTRRRHRLNVKRHERSEKERKASAQTSIFEALPTANTRQLSFDDMIQPDKTELKSKGFDAKLKKALDFDPKNKSN